jgi:hypothetical protein
MKKLIVVFLFLLALFAKGQTPLTFSSLTNYTGNLDSVRYVGLLKSGNVWTNRTFYGIDLIKGRVKYLDSLSIFITPYQLASNVYTKTQSDANYPLINGGYTNPSWIVAFPWSKVSGTPNTLAGYGIRDAVAYFINDTRFDSLVIQPNDSTIKIKSIGLTNGYAVNITRDITDTSVHYVPNADSLILASWLRLYKVRDSLQALITANTNSISSNTTAIAGKEPTITAPFTTKKYWNGYKSFVTLNSDSLNEGSTNLFFTNSRVQSFSDGRYELIITPPYSVKKYWNGYKNFVSLNSDSLAEGSTNLFFTNARAQNAISLTTTGSSGVATYNAGVLNIPNYSAGGGMTNPMTTLGDIIYEDGTPTAVRLAGNTTSTKKFLTQTGNGSVSAGPGWNTIVAGDIPTLNQNTTGSAGSISGTNVITNANIVQAAANSFKGNNTGSAANQIDMTVSQAKILLAITESDVTNLTSDLSGKLTNPLTTLGDIIYENSTPAPTRLAGNITTTKKFLTQTGDGANSAVPGWNIIASGDIPTLNQNTTGTASNITGVLNATSFPALTGDISTSSGSVNTTLATVNSNVFGSNTLLKFAVSGKGLVTSAATVVAGDIPNLAESQITNLSTDLSNKQPITSVSSALTAAGTNQSTALALSGNNSIQEVTTTASGTGVKLPVSSVTSSVVVVNRGANTLVVYPGSSGVINGQSANAGYSIPSGSVATFLGKDGTSWYTENSFTSGDASTTDASGLFTVTGIKGVSVPALSAGFLKYTGAAWSFDASTYLTANQSISFTPGAGGDVTGTSSGATSLTPTLVIGANKVTNSLLAQMSANTFKANNTGSTANASDITAAQAKTLLAITESDVSNLTTDLSGKQAITTLAAGLTAAGSTQGTALALTGSNSVQEITTAAASTGVSLPVATTSSRVTVINRGANPVTVYPASSGIINGQSANAGYTLGVNNTVTFVGKSATSWYTEQNFQGGDVATTDGSNSLVVGTNKITYAKLQQASSGSLLGNNTGGTANVAEVFLTSPLAIVGGNVAVSMSTDNTFVARSNGTIGNKAFGGQASITAVSGAINTTETSLTSYTIPASSLIAGTTFRIMVFGTCTSTAANASNIRVRLGTGGTTSDAVAAVVTPTAATSGTNIPFQAVLYVTIRTTGSGGTMGGNGALNNNGVTGISSSADVIGTPQSAVAVNTTVQNIISLWYVSAATTTTSTFQIASIEIVKM